MMHSAQPSWRTIETVSSRSASASWAARSGPSSGMSRVFTAPGAGGLTKMQTIASRFREASVITGRYAQSGALFWHGWAVFRPHFFLQGFFGDAPQPPDQHDDGNQSGPQQASSGHAGVGPATQKIGGVTHHRSQIDEKDSRRKHPDP